MFPLSLWHSFFFLRYKSSCTHMLIAEVFQRSSDKWPKHSACFSSGDWMLMGTVIKSLWLVSESGSYAHEASAKRCVSKIYISYSNVTFN